MTKQRQNDDITVTCIKQVILAKNNTDIDRPSQNIKHPLLRKMVLSVLRQEGLFLFSIK